MKKYKVYAKILGYVLPEEATEIGECKIEKISQEEQNKRQFKPLEGWSGDDFQTSYFTYPRGADFRIMKSDYIISGIFESHSPNGAIGLAEERFSKVLGAFMLYAKSWWSQNHPKNNISFSEYDFQICKVYEIVKKNTEIEVNDLKPTSTRTSMCNYPASNIITSDFSQLFEYYFYCNDDVFRKSLKYFVNGTRGLNYDYPEEKVFLDLFKSIELIILNLKKYRTRRFKIKVKFAQKALRLTKSDINSIHSFWDIRSNGDFAHARKRENYLPPQYPTPSNCGPFINSFNFQDLVELSQKIIINYFHSIKDTYRVLINPGDQKFYKDNDLTFIFDAFNPSYLSWDRNYFVIKTKEKNKRKLTPFIKKKIAIELKCKVNQLKVIESNVRQMKIKIIKN